MKFINGKKRVSETYLKKLLVQNPGRATVHILRQHLEYVSPICEILSLLVYKVNYDRLYGPYRENKTTFFAEKRQER